MPVKQLSSWSLLRICVVVGALSLWVLLELNIERTDLTILVPRISESQSIDGITSYSGFLVNTDGCRIPDLDPMDASIRKFIYDDKPLNCEQQYGPALVVSDLTSVYVDESVLPHYNISDISQLVCCYRPFWRVELKWRADGQYPSGVDSNYKFAKNCTMFYTATTISDEFIQTECYFNNSTIYMDYHAFIPAKDLVSGQVNEQLHAEEAVSVLMVGVDAVSRLNLYRQMPQTVKFLKKSLNAIEMLGYNKVEDNTFPNLVPVLTGLSEEELKRTCWPSTDSVFDNCFFVWDSYKSAGYRTAFGEDASWMGMFSYVKRGFRKQPTDYYMKVFNKVSEEKIGFEKRMNAKLCVGPRKNLETLLNYADKFVNTMKDVLSFGFFWGASLTHDYLNLPKFGDKEHKNFLENLYDRGIFNRTVLVFMSDHGIRWGGIRETYQGFLEERLPFLFIVYPDWFRVKYTTAVSNLKKNAHKLTTPFDLHQVLIDLMNMTRLEKDVLKTRSEGVEKAKPLPRGISLFLPIPGSRTCADSGIVDHWCTCHQSTGLPTNDTQVRRAAGYLVKHINTLLREYSQCAKLQLNAILTAREETSTANFTASSIAIKDFSITIETAPGQARFEATVRHDGNSGSYSLVGTISRINLYGNQSQCVPQYKLRLYCYCIHN